MDTKHTYGEVTLKDVRQAAMTLRSKALVNDEALEDAIWTIELAADYVTKWSEDDPTGLREAGWSLLDCHEVWSAETLADNVAYERGL